MIVFSQTKNAWMGFLYFPMMITMGCGGHWLNILLMADPYGHKDFEVTHVSHLEDLLHFWLAPAVWNKVW